MSAGKESWSGSCWAGMTKKDAWSTNKSALLMWCMLQAISRMTHQDLLTRAASPAAAPHPRGHLTGQSSTGIAQAPYRSSVWKLTLERCSMGGVLIKDLLARAASPAAVPHHQRLAANTVGLIFFACPHRGSWLANWGW